MGDISNWEVRLDSALAAYRDAPFGAADADVATTLGVVPVFHDWSAFGGIRLDGTIVWVEYEPPYAVTPIEDPVHRNMILFVAARRYPMLAGLAPIRPAGAGDCPSCGGTGVFHYQGEPIEMVNCFCGGVGWLPVGYRYPAT